MTSNWNLNERCEQNLLTSVERASARRGRSRCDDDARHSIVGRVQDLSLARRRRAVVAAARFPYQRRRILRRGRSLRLRQIHASEDDLRAVAALDRRNFRRGRGGHKAAWQCRHRVPEFAAAALAQHPQQRDVADRHEAAVRARNICRGRKRCSSSSGSKASRRSCPGSSPAACSSGPRSAGRWCTTPRSC